jgi:hypothetical protein
MYVCSQPIKAEEPLPVNPIRSEPINIAQTLPKLGVPFSRLPFPGSKIVMEEATHLNESSLQSQTPGGGGGGGGGGDTTALNLLQTKTENYQIGVGMNQLQREGVKNIKFNVRLQVNLLD